MKFLAAAFIFSSLGSMAAADIAARFIESAPKDRFVFTNVGTCPLADVVLNLDLSESTAGLIFDTTNSGAGVDVFQPFELVAGAALVSAPPRVRDGMNKLSLTVPVFPAGAQIAFTVDVDDTLASSDLGQTRVSGSEINGAVLRVGPEIARFDTSGKATVPASGCNA